MQDAFPPNVSDRTLPIHVADLRCRFEEALNRVVAQKQHLRQATARLYEEAARLKESVGRFPRCPRAEKAPAGSEGDINALSPRERQVLQLIAEGLSTKQIAGELQISFKTAVCYRTHLLKKLRVHESASLVRIAIRMGLLSA